MVPTQFLLHLLIIIIPLSCRCCIASTGVHVSLFVGFWKQAWTVAVCFQWCNWQAEAEVALQGVSVLLCVAIHRSGAGSLGLQLFPDKIWAHLPWRYLCLLCVLFPPGVFIIIIITAHCEFCVGFLHSLFGGDAFNFVLILRWLEISEQMISDGESLLILSTKWEMPYAQIWFLCFFFQRKLTLKTDISHPNSHFLGKKKYIFHQNMSDTGLCQVSRVS